MTANAKNAGATTAPSREISLPRRPWLNSISRANSGELYETPRYQIPDPIDSIGHIAFVKVFEDPPVVDVSGILVIWLVRRFCPFQRMTTPELQYGKQRSAVSDTTTLITNPRPSPTSPSRLRRSVRFRRIRQNRIGRLWHRSWSSGKGTWDWFSRHRQWRLFGRNRYLRWDVGRCLLLHPRARAPASAMPTARQAVLEMAGVGLM